MNFLKTGLASVILVTLPGSCIAQTLPPNPKPMPVIRVVKPSVPSVAIGPFLLDRSPEQGRLARGFVPVGTKRLVIDGRDVAFATDRRFVVGFGRDYAASALMTAFLEDGRSVTSRMPVQPRKWITENLTRLPHHAQPDAEFQARRPAELSQINAARRMVTDAKGWRQNFIWPTRGRISGFFGSQRIYAGQPGAPHSGVDVAGVIGTPVVSPADGVIILAASSPFTLEGNLLMIDHGMGVNSAFLHLSHIDVNVGDRVQQGQRVGAIGMTGRATGPHLHWGMKWQDERLDPQAIAGPMGSVR
ncbi:MAG: M23 family metallopeptidase [Chakrabartia sp.]